MHTFCACKATDNKAILHTSASLYNINMTNGTVQAPPLLYGFQNLYDFPPSLHGKEKTQR